MVTGELAASAVLASRDRGRIVPERARRAYVRAWRAEIGAELRDSVLIQRYLFRTRERMDGVVAVANSQPEFSQWLVDYASGRLSYQAARRRLVSRFPKLLPKLAWVAWRGR